MTALLLRRRSLLSPAAPPPSETFDGFTEPFVSQTYVLSSSGVTFAVNTPTKDAGNPLFTTGTETDAWDRDKSKPSVTKDDDGWHMVYGGIDTSGNWCVCYASSVDGETWTKPNIGRVTYGGNTNNNIILGSETPQQHFYDAPSGKWVLVVEPDIDIYTADTVDGVYTLVKTITPATYGEGKGVVRRADGRWVAYYVAGHGTQTRSVHAYLSDTTDLDGAYTFYGKVLPSAAQTEQFYLLAPTRIGSMFYGAVSRYNKTTEQVHGDLFASTDGLHFQLLDSEWLPRGASTTWDDEMVYPDRITEVGDDWHVYYGGAPANHAASLPRNSKIGRATIDRGRIGQVGSTGSVTTRDIVVATGATMTVNANASGGTLKIEVQDDTGAVVTGYAEADFDTISTDGYDHVPTWGGLPLPDNQTLRLKFVLSSATLYGYEISDATPIPYDPLTDIAWHDAFWTDDPDWSRPAPDAAVSSWRNGATGGGFGAAAQATSSKQPVFRIASSLMKYRPVVGSQTDDALATGTGTALTQPTTLVMIGYQYGAAGAATKIFMDGVSATERNVLMRANDRWFFNAGTSVDTGDSIDTSPHLHVVTFNGASSQYELDGTVIGTGNAGAQSINGVTLFNHQAHTFGSDIAMAFAAVLDGTLTAGEKAALLAWSRSYYGTP